jgi:hypothetical protein
VDHEQRILDIPGLLNVRDLGGLPVEGGGQTQFGGVIRGSDADKLEQPGVSALIDQVGISREIDLRDEMSGAAGPGSLLAQQVEERHQLSVYEDSDAKLTIDRLMIEWEWDQSEEYITALTTPAGITSILALLSDESEHTTYVHCNVGKDRTGLISALILSAVGVEREAVIEDYALSALDTDEWLQRMYAAQDKLGEITRRANPNSVRSFMSARSENMAKTLDYIDTNFGIAADYVRGLPNGDEILEGLRRKLVEAWE